MNAFEDAATLTHLNHSSSLTLKLDPNWLPPCSCMSFTNINKRKRNALSKRTQTTYLKFAKKRWVYDGVDENNCGQEDEGKHKSQRQTSRGFGL
jgi:hypothetical protein